MVRSVNTFTKCFQSVVSMHVAWILSGALIGVPFIYDSFWWLFLPSIILFLYCFLNAPTKNIFYGVMFVGFCKSAASVLWFWSTYPLVWVGDMNALLQYAIIFLYWSTTALSMSVGFALTFYLYSRFVRVSIKNLFFIPFVWVFAEICGSLMYSLFTLGSGSSLNSNFSFGYIGYLLIDIPVVSSLAKFGGVYSLSFIAVAVSLYVYILFSSSRKDFSRVVLAVSTVIIICLLLYINYSTTKPFGVKKTIITIDTLFDSFLFLEKDGYRVKNDAIVEAVSSALGYSSDNIVLPEDSRFTSAFDSPQEALKFIVKNSQGRDVLVFDSARVIDDRGKTVLRAFVYDTKAVAVYVVDKQYLVAQGEYIPYVHGLLIYLVAPNSLSQKLFSNHNYKSGEALDYSKFPSYVAPVLFCFEGVDPRGIKKLLTRQKSSLIIHPVSHSWFNNSEVLTKNLDYMLKAQAMWNNVYIIEAGNMKQGYLYTPTGERKNGVMLKKSDRWELKTFEIES